MIEIPALVLTLGLLDPDPMCLMDAPLSRSSEETAVLLAVATGETTFVPVPEGRWFAHVTEARVVAYTFDVREVVGAEDQLERGDLVLAVPWGYDAGCDLEMWDGAEWVPARDTVVFLHPAGEILESESPAIHVLGWHSPFPHGHEFWKPQADREAWLTPREYFSLLLQLPFKDPHATREENLERLERVFREGDPRWSEHYPGTEILRRARMWASGARRSFPVSARLSSDGIRRGDGLEGESGSTRPGS